MVSVSSMLRDRETCNEYVFLKQNEVFQPTNVSNGFVCVDV